MQLITKLISWIREGFLAESLKVAGLSSFLAAAMDWI